MENALRTRKLVMFSENLKLLEKFEDIKAAAQTKMEIKNTMFCTVLNKI